MVTTFSPRWHDACGLWIQLAESQSSGHLHVQDYTILFAGRNNKAPQKYAMQNYANKVKNNASEFIWPPLV